jgi:hypothetical protein
LPQEVERQGGELTGDHGRLRVNDLPERNVLTHQAAENKARLGAVDNETGELRNAGAAVGV